MVVSSKTHVTLKAYKREKLSLLKDFCVALNYEQTERLMGMSTEIEIDNFCRDIIAQSYQYNKHLKPKRRKGQ